MPLEAGAGGLPKVVLSAPDGSATAEVYLHGATLASWVVEGEERLFVSPKAAFQPPKAVRGGVPVCFPQFGTLGPMAQQHGFARNVEWALAEEGAGRCVLALDSSDATLAQWPHPFRLEMEVSLAATGVLHQKLRVKNTGSESLQFTCALHTYFRVSDIANVQVVGLKGLDYWDNAAGGQQRDEAEAVTFPGEVDRAYIGAPAVLKIADAGPRSVLLIHKHGFADAVVWNPAEAKAASMGDLGADNWRGFVCVEVAQARSGAVQLQAGQEWAASQTLEYDTLGES